MRFGKIGILVNYIIQKLKSKHLHSLSQFSLVTGFFEATRENIFTYSRPKGLFLAFTLHPTRCQYPLINYLGFHRISRQMGGMASRIQFLGIQRKHSCWIRS